MSIHAEIVWSIAAARIVDWPRDVAGFADTNSFNASELWKIHVLVELDRVHPVRPTNGESPTSPSPVYENMQPISKHRYVPCTHH